MTDVAQTVETDVLIVGAGPVGLALALALADSPLRTVIIDRDAEGAWQTDLRALALSHGSRQVLGRLGAWSGDKATPIRRIHVSQHGGFGSTMIDATDYEIPALGYVMRYRDLLSELRTHLAAGQLIAPARLIDLDTTPDAAILTLDEPNKPCRIAARLVVHAEGTPPAGPGVGGRDYGQHAIVCEVVPETPHDNLAWERFTPAGPLALLPLGDGYALIVAAPSDEVARIRDLSDSDFLAEIARWFGNRITFASSGPRALFPLSLRLRRRLTSERQVWLGNAAQTLHPVSGQGFNLGLRDAWELAETVLDQGGDPGSAKTLAAYTARRRIDRLAGIAFTDGIVRLFSNDTPPVKTLRGVGLLALDMSAPLRDFLARRMIWGARAWP